MLVNFKRNFQIDGVFYQSGTREVPHELKSNWYFKALLSEKLAEIVPSNAGDAQPVAPSKAPAKVNKKVDATKG